jgi:uridine phosphorylase
MKSEIVLNKGKVYHLGVPPGLLAPNLIVVGDPQRALKVATYFDQVENQFTNREYLTICGSYKNNPCTVIGTGIGTDNVEIAIIEAYALLCLDLGLGEPPFEPSEINLIRVGTSGGIQPNMKPGTLIISTYAIGLDNTGMYYDLPACDSFIVELEKATRVKLDAQMPASMRFKGKLFPYGARASVKLSQGLVKQAKLLDTSFETGITASTPGFYGPSGRFIQGLNNSLPDIKEILSEIRVGNLKILNMEMESSLIFHLCSHLGIEAATICPAISAVSNDTELIDHQPFIDLSIEIALEALLDR